MTSSQRISWLLVTLGCIAAVAIPASAEHHEDAKAGHGPEVIEVVSTNVQGKNVYIPSTIVVAEHMPHTLSIFNTTDMRHGFAIADLGIEVVLEPGVETKVALPALDGEKIYRIHCQLHPAHRSAQLVVLDTD